MTQDQQDPLRTFPIRIRASVRERLHRLARHVSVERDRKVSTNELVLEVLMHELEKAEAEYER